MTESIADIAFKHGGLITSKQVTDAGISRSRLSEMVRSGQIERVEYGVYRLPDAWEDEFKVAQLRFPRGVFSDGTALFLHGFTDLTPERLTMTFSRSYNATKARTAGIEVRTCSNDVLDLGVAIVRTPYGNEVRSYDLERTLCDIVRGQKTVDIQIVNPAMKAYARMKGKSLAKLFEYARALGVEKKIRNYMEVLL